ncbi:class C sortase [Candidatus Enterococcus ikei]|nr:class C sortase [Enterococcus sp. DIV0869a]
MTKTQVQKRKKNTGINILMGSIFLTGFLLFSYPILSNLYANFYHTRVIDTYQKEVNQKSRDEKMKLVKDMMNYNKDMITGGELVGEDPFDNKNEKKPEKKDKKHKVIDALQNKLGDVLGYITIPEINVKLPVYSGASDLQLQKGIGVLEGTSLPIGGKNTHSVLTGHRGLPSSKLFSDLPELKKGDTFFIDIIGETHEYRINQIKTVLPEDIADLKIVSEKDYITLLTCTPYMINTHRLLVRGERIPLEKKAKEKKMTNWCCYLNIALQIIIILLILLFWRYVHKTNKKQKLREKKRLAQKKKRKHKVE